MDVIHRLYSVNSRVEIQSSDGPEGVTLSDLPCFLSVLFQRHPAFQQQIDGINGFAFVEDQFVGIEMGPLLLIRRSDQVARPSTEQRCQRI